MFMGLLYGVFFIFGIAILFATMIWLVVWILRSLAVYQIAKRRGLANAWLSWLPVGQDWIVGSISDQYQYLVGGKVCHKRKLLLGFSAASFVFSVITIIMTIGFFSGLGVNSYIYGYGDFDYYYAMQSVGMTLMLMFFAVVAIVTFIFRCICKYDLYRSCEPKNAVAYLVLGILFGILDPIFLMICRNKEQGMPPRKPEYGASAEQKKFL